MRKHEMTLAVSAVAGDTVYKRINAVGNEEEGEYAVCAEHYQRKDHDVKKRKRSTNECCDNECAKELTEIEAELEHTSDGIADIAPVDQVEIKGEDISHDFCKGIPEVLCVINDLIP